VAERYPELKADASFRNLAGRVTALETAIADRREIYNDAANAQNIRIETFPDAIIAGMFNFAPARLLKFDATQTADVNVGAAFGR
jgi:LemA protein